MLNEAQLQRAMDALPFLRGADARTRQEFAARATLMRLPAGATVFEEGAECSALAILLGGQVRVFKIGETGREITLYRFARGESCILTAGCILGDHRFPAIAAIEHEAEAVLIAAADFHDWMGRIPAWRDYVFQLLSQRLATLMMVLEEVAFRRMDARVADLLLQRSHDGRATLRLTHAEIAADLGTSREVVSRIVEDLSEKGLVSAQRGSITVLDRARLERHALAPQGMPRGPGSNG